jgi:S1-C subfamily serine protease
MTIKDKTTSAVNYLERALGPATKITIGIIGLVALASSLYLSTKKTSNVTSPTVMITNLAGNHGGSGVVINTSADESEILTNSHVCGVVVDGGKVTTTYGESHVVKYYKRDTDHDLCLIVVAAELKDKAKVAASKPSLYEEAIISGHPALLPNVVSTGHFSGNKVISVFYGIEKCTEAQLKDPMLELICYFYGGIPLVKTYEAGVVTALIMGGSSGSAVYNSKQELSGLAFAGKGDLSYAFIVPFEYVSSFLSKNPKGSREGFTRPNYNVDILAKQTEQNRRRNREIVRRCSTDVTASTNPKIAELCDIIADTLKWQNEL